MKLKLYDNKLISPLCKFRDKDLERLYRSERTPVLRRYFLRITVAFSIVYFAFLISDYFLTDTAGFALTVIARLITISLPFILYFSTGKLKKVDHYNLTLLLVESFYAFSYIFILSQELSPDYYLKIFDVTMIILAIFLIPSVWLTSVFTSFLNLLLFVIYSYFRFPQIPVRIFGSMSVYLVLVFLLSAVGSFKTSATRRIEFYDNLQLHRLLNTDTLTGLYNRKKFDEELHRFLEQNTGRELSFCIFDIDDFKLVNDNYGHLAGDQVLIGISEAVMKYKRPQDIVARWGGEEFVMILPDCPLHEARDRVEGLRIKLDSLHFEKQIKITCSFGLTLLRQNDTHDSLLKRADHLLYKAKQMGKDLVMIDDWTSSEDQIGLW